MSEGSADSMPIFVIILGILIFGIGFVILSEPANMLVDTMNELIADGQISEQTSHYFDTSIGMFEISPLFFIIGLVLFSLERSKGNNIPHQTYFQYLILMFAGICISIILVFFFGITLDSILYGLSDQVLMDVPESWDSSSKLNFFIRLIYYGSLLPGLIASCLYMFHPIIVQVGNIFSLGGSSEEEEEFEYEAESLSLQQF